MNRPKTGNESGFALLFVFAMAAAVAIMLYAELPRAVFESQRTKEGLLVERGEQYQRAIQIYFRKFRKYPARIEELESTNNIRFLRRRYVDPMTGKDEWRLIHIGPAGEFVDSAVHKPKTPTKDEKADSRNPQAADPALAAAEGPVGVAFRQRPSDKLQPGTASATGEIDPAQQPGQYDPNAPAPPPGSNLPTQSGAQFPGQVPGQVATFPGQPGTYPGQPGTVATALPQYAPPFPAEPTQQPNTQTSQFPGLPGQVPFPGQFPGLPSGGQPRRSSQSMGLANPVAYQGVPAGFPVQGAPMPGYPTSAANSQLGGGQQGGPNPNVNPALDLIRNLLTTPRPGGLAGGAQPSAPGFTGGIAGVASKYESRGIKLINERDKIHEWEFLYDFRQDRTVAGRLGAAGGTGSVVGFPTAPPNLQGSPQSGFPPGAAMPGSTTPGGLPPGAGDSRGIRGRGRQ